MPVTLGAPAARRRTPDRLWPLPAQHQPGRAAGIVERAAGRYEPGRPAAAADAVPGPLHPRTGAAARGAPRHHRLGADQRPQRDRLGAKVCAGCVVCGSFVILARHEDNSLDALENRQA